MLTFPCNHCGMRIKLFAGMPGEKALCFYCNTRQLIPQNAVPIPDPPPLPPRLPAQPLHTGLQADADKPPTYEFVTVIGIIFIVVALLMATIIAMFAMLHPPESFLMLTGLLSPLALIAFVLVMFMIRDIAIHTWHLRKNQPR